MNKRTGIWLILAVMLAGGASFSGTPVQCPPPRGVVCYRYCAEPRYAPAYEKVKVFVTNDVHGYVFEEENRGRIGYAKLRGRMDAARDEGYSVVLMDAGDAFSGNAMAQFDSGASVAELMGAMGYRVLAPGNHAFDYNASENNPLYYSNVLLSKLRAASEGAVSATALNLSYKGGPVPGMEQGPVVVLEEDGFRLVAVGVITPYVATRSNRAAVRDYAFGLVERDGEPDHQATKEGILAALTEALAPYDRPGDVVVVLSHVGSDEIADYAHGELRGSDLAMVPNVDFVADAHSHNVLPARRMGAAYYGLAGRYLENFAEITIDREGGGLELGMEIRGYAAVDAAPSQAMLERLRDVSDRLGLGDRLFSLPSLLDDAGINAGSLPLGRFLCRTMRTIGGGDLAVHNSGGIRSAMGGGWVTVGSVYDCIPYQNNLIVVAMRGAEIRDLFANMLVRGVNAFPQFEGMTVYAWERGRDEALGVAGILDADGKPLDMDGTYNVVVNSFMGSGGDGYRFNLDNQRRDVGDTVTTLVDYFRRVGLPEWAGETAKDSLLVYSTREAAEEAFREK